jgi:nitric oxide reductase NorD protein
VIAVPAKEQGEHWTPDAVTQRNIRQVRRQFEALRPRRQIIQAQPDGDDLDLSMLVRDIADRRAGEAGTDRVFTDARSTARDLSLAVLMDVSLSTDAWIGDRRVLDVEKASLLALTHGLTACGDEHAIFTFTSRRRTSVTVSTVKDFDEPLDGRVVSRIEALKPGQYTRIGAAVRHVTTELAKRPHRHRLLLLLTDGKPNDIDHYEGRYGIEDTRMAIREARKIGLRVFGVTIDENARDYFPHIFGRGAYAIIGDVARLPMALPAIYRQIAS